MPDHPRTFHNSAPKTNGDHRQTKEAEPDVLKLLPGHPRRLREYLSCYVDAKTDGVNRSVRNVLFWIVSAALGFVAVAGLIVIAGWLMLSGIAEGLGVLLGDRPWLGNSVTGFLLLTGLGLGMYYAAARRKKTSRERDLIRNTSPLPARSARSVRARAEQAARDVAGKVKEAAAKIVARVREAAQRAGLRP